MIRIDDVRSTSVRRVNAGIRLYGTGRGPDSDYPDSATRGQPSTVAIVIACWSERQPVVLQMQIGW